jgi:hypothetical protein
MESAPARVAGAKSADGTLWGCDEVDPLLWFETKHILASDKYSETAKLLDEFIATRSERLPVTPVNECCFSESCARCSSG